MELRHIRYFLAVAEEGSFTKAAQKLMIAQPPLSRQIKDLEEELGTELFIRRNRGLSLTEAGNRFRVYASRIASLAKASMEEIREMNKGLSGTVFLGTVEGCAPRLLAEWVTAFHRKYPLVDFNIWNGSSDDVVNRVNSGLCDMGIITAPYDEEGLEGIPVHTEPWIAMIPAGHPLAKERSSSVKIEDLAPYELIIPSRHSRKKEIEGWFALVHKEPKIICRIAHMLNAYELTAHGLGITIYPAAAAEYASEDVCIKPLSHPAVSATYILIRSNSRTHSLVAREFWDAVPTDRASL